MLGLQLRLLQNLLTTHHSREDVVELVGILLKIFTHSKTPSSEYWEEKVLHPNKDTS